MHGSSPPLGLLSKARERCWRILCWAPCSASMHSMKLITVELTGRWPCRPSRRKTLHPGGQGWTPVGQHGRKHAACTCGVLPSIDGQPSLLQANIRACQRTQHAHSAEGWAPQIRRPPPTCGLQEEALVAPPLAAASQLGACGQGGQRGPDCDDGLLSHGLSSMQHSTCCRIRCSTAPAVRPQTLHSSVTPFHPAGLSSPSSRATAPTFLLPNLDVFKHLVHLLRGNQRALGHALVKRVPNLRRCGEGQGGRDSLCRQAGTSS